MIPSTFEDNNGLCPECNGTGLGFTAHKPCATCGAFLTSGKNYSGKWSPDLTDEERYVVAHHPYHMNRHERRQRSKDLRRKDGKRRNVRT